MRSEGKPLQSRITLDSQGIEKMNCTILLLWIAQLLCDMNVNLKYSTDYRWIEIESLSMYLATIRSPLFLIFRPIQTTRLSYSESVVDIRAWVILRYDRLMDTFRGRIFDTNTGSSLTPLAKAGPLLSCMFAFRF